MGRIDCPLRSSSRVACSTRRKRSSCSATDSPYLLHKNSTNSTKSTTLKQTQLLSNNLNGLFGDALGSKPTTDVRLVFESFNGLAAWKPINEKIVHARRFLHRLSADCYAGTECNVQWSLLKSPQQLHSLFSSEVPVKAVSAHNVHERHIRSQAGGTGIITFDHMSTLFQSSGHDESGLGRWCWIGHKDKSGVMTRIIVAYQPSCTEARQFDTVYQQHRRYFRQRGNKQCPRRLFRDNLLAQLATWRAAGDRLILFIDANENINNGKLQRALRQPHIGLTDSLF